MMTHNSTVERERIGEPIDINAQSQVAFSLLADGIYAILTQSKSLEGLLTSEAREQIPKLRVWADKETIQILLTSAQEYSFSEKEVSHLRKALAMIDKQEMGPQKLIIMTGSTFIQSPFLEDNFTIFAQNSRPSAHSTLNKKAPQLSL
jgi:hypothetical protein